MSQNVQNTLPKMFLVWEEDCLVLLCIQLIHIVNQWSKNSIHDKRAFGVCFRYLMWLFFFFRVFSDRLIDAGDHEAFVALLSDKLGTMFDLTFHNLCPNKQPPIFGKSLSLTRGFLDRILYDHRNITLCCRNTKSICCKTIFSWNRKASKVSLFLFPVINPQN